MIVLAVLLPGACALYLFVASLDIRLYGSQWLPGFLLALIGAAFGLRFLFPHRKQSFVFRIATFFSLGILALYGLWLTPIAYLFGT
ncbi:hypothetical protein [Saccharibacillus deserti]|uniref:hypothetical protein n=1 Tax=Saccharibacillus deserti TaxID=1634444 RepID=UPI001553B9BB|nr:hypothetical protein [Saccharibacillus deserti]